MLVRSFNLIDIKRYEQETGNNILLFFNNFSIAGLLDLISLGNGHCSGDRAADILDNYLSSDNKTMLDAILEIKDVLIGVGDNKEVEEEDEESNNKIDISKYESLTDLYINFSMQLMSVGLSYQDFWSMNTKELFKVFNSIYIKMQNDTNRELSNYHTLAAMVGGAVWGKLSKEPPKVDMTSRQEYKDKDLDDEDMMMIARLKSIANIQNKQVKQSKKGDE